ncbi:MAG: preprotein translocase subunit SecE [Rickettsiales bacterium]|nr:preprotein translocase subunit SecE [Rickettsiales bacterium]
MNKVLTYIRDVRLEWFKIVWPNRDIVVRSTILIFVFSGAAALFLFVVDGVMSAVAGWIF